MPTLQIINRVETTFTHRLSRNNSLHFNFIEDLKSYSTFKFEEYLSIPVESRWLWILGGGCIPLDSSELVIQRSAQHSIFIRGTSVEQGFNRKDSNAIQKAYDQFLKIQAEFKRNSIIAYPDGSRDTNSSGAGAVLYQNGNKIVELVCPIIHFSIDFCELYAVYYILRWLQTELSDQV